MTRVDATPFIHTCGLFDEFLQLRGSRRYLEALQGLPAWELAAGEELPLDANRRGSVAVLTGAAALRTEPGAPDDSEPEPGAAAGRRVFGQWTGLRGVPMEDRVAALEPATFLECAPEMLRQLLRADGVASTFGVEFFRPLLQGVAAIADTPAPDLDGVIRASVFSLRRDGEIVVRRGDPGQTMFFILEGEVAVEEPGAVEPVMGPGGFFGELAVITQAERTATLRARGDVLLMECPRRAVGELRKKSKTFKTAIQETYRERMLAAHLRTVPLFQGLGPEELETLRRVGQLDTFEPYEPVVLQGDAADSLFVTLNGTLHVVMETGEGPVPVAAIRGGETVGEMALSALGGPGIRSTTVTALQNVDVVRIPEPAVAEVINRHPAVADRLRETAARRFRNDELRDPESPAVEALGWMMETQHGAGEAVLAVDMRDCIRCGSCVAACAAVHDDGISRFHWAGMREDDRFMPEVRLSNSCQHCEFALCMRYCPTNCITRSPGGAVFIDYDRCIQCGTCGDPSKGCPYGSIQIVSAAEARPAPQTTFLQQLLARFRPQPAGGAPKEEPRQGDRYPAKCDLCEGLAFQACVQSCPTDAVFRLDGSVQFADALERLATGGAAPPAKWESFHLAVERHGAATPNKPFDLNVAVAREGPGRPLHARIPEAGVPDVTLNLYLSASEEFRIGGSAMRQLIVPGGSMTGRDQYRVTGRTPGEHTLNLLVYQGGLYLGRESLRISVEAPDGSTA